jgi:hypothetical protein
MTVEYSPLKSNYGFASPGFAVDELGNVNLTNTIVVDGNASVYGTLFVNKLQIAGAGASFDIIENDDSTLTLSKDIKNSHLRNLGVLERLEVDGDVFIGISSTNFISIDNGSVVINSSETGNMDNIAIGENTPADATFLDAVANNTPTLASHLTRKDYVDARVTAFSIAFGA